MQIKWERTHYMRNSSNETTSSRIILPWHRSKFCASYSHRPLEDYLILHSPCELEKPSDLHRCCPSASSPPLPYFDVCTSSLLANRILAWVLQLSWTCILGKGYFFRWDFVELKKWFEYIYSPGVGIILHRRRLTLRHFQPIVFCHVTSSRSFLSSVVLSAAFHKFIIEALTIS